VPITCLLFDGILKTIDRFRIPSLVSPRLGKRRPFFHSRMPDRAIPLQIDWNLTPRLEVLDPPV